MNNDIHVCDDMGLMLMDHENGYCWTATKWHFSEKYLYPPPFYDYSKRPPRMFIHLLVERRMAGIRGSLINNMGNGVSGNAIELNNNHHHANMHMHDVMSAARELWYSNWTLFWGAYSFAPIHHDQETSLHRMFAPHRQHGLRIWAGWGFDGGVAGHRRWGPEVSKTRSTAKKDQRTSLCKAMFIKWHMMTMMWYLHLIRLFSGWRLDVFAFSWSKNGFFLKFFFGQYRVSPLSTPSGHSELHIPLKYFSLPFQVQWVCQGRVDSMGITWLQPYWWWKIK